ncbi:MAG: hypothetical protein N2166_03900 [candidate division WOR-3 bacterium]|nr:hypothetical protein [candidate division WOR-3 bacterium]
MKLRILGTYAVCLIFIACQLSEKPQIPLRPLGPDSGLTNIPYNFRSSSVDSNNDSIAIQFDWGDGNFSYWSRWYRSGETITMSHIWHSPGTYFVKALAKNKDGKYSDWSEEHRIIILPSQSWVKTFGGEYNERGYAIERTLDNGFIIAGPAYYYPYTVSAIYLAKTDALGNLQWARYYDLDQGEIIPHTIKLTSDGGYIICGEANNNIFVLKTDVNGNPLWEQTFTANIFQQRNELVETPDRGFILVGTKRGLSDDLNIWLIKINSSGNIQWQKTLGQPNINEFGYSIKPTHDGGYILAGSCSQYYFNTYLMIVKVNSSGDLIWSRYYLCDIDYLSSCQIVTTFDGNFVCAYSTTDEQIALIKLTANGEVVWQKTALTNGIFWSATETSDHGYYISGIWGDDEFPCIVKTNVNGDLEWFLPIGAFSSAMISSDEHGAGLQFDDGGYVLVCWTDAFNNENDDVYLIKLAGGKK